MPEIVSINLAQRYAVLADGRVWKITSLIGRLGEETVDEREAVAFVAEGDGQAISAPVADFSRPITLN